MRIVSLLPSATEILFALGLDAEVVGVSYDCDFPPQVSQRRVVCLDYTTYRSRVFTTANAL